MKYVFCVTFRYNKDGYVGPLIRITNLTVEEAAMLAYMEDRMYFVGKITT